MTTDAWAVAQELAQGETQAGFRPVRKRTANELRAHGIISGDDVLDPEWQRLLSVLGRAPVVQRILASHRDVTLHTDVVVLPDIALAVTQRRTSTHDPAGPRAVTGVELAVEVVLFGHDEIWRVVRRVIPDIPALRADADPSVPEEPISVSDEDQARVAAITKMRHGARPSSREAIDLMRDPDPRLRDLLDAEAEVSVLGLARRPGRSHVDVQQWSVGRQGLYLSRTQESDDTALLMEVGPGHLGAEVERGLDRLIAFARGTAAA
ncbi:hypothetical protein [Janibacter anophelis]|uniref:hypothetical protein n=1 Tax=Janibacter anophelis TaxID=319054 RepID=UPI0013B04F13|nr:hypothetical protein [Janibacter anophelis]